MIRKIFNINRKGSAAVEMAFVIPFAVVILAGFYFLFQWGHGKQRDLVIRQQADAIRLHKRQMAVPVLERPCQVQHPAIKALCEGRGR
ncbi:MAG: hypothetical protein Q8P84_06220 [Deltaproteobacteria bacterium]|nr:hypothetical protein [Deltaproteobacteria bacterium]